MLKDPLAASVCCDRPALDRIAGALSCGWPGVSTVVIDVGLVIIVMAIQLTVSEPADTL